MRVKEIPNSEAAKITTTAGRVHLIREYGRDSFPYVGVNEDGEKVHISISTTGIVVQTYQDNGWVRVNYYGVDGKPEGETFDGRWKSVQSTEPQPQEESDDN